ncbi:MAG: MBL fold metallo-hydrolase [Methylocystis sp.]|nr:MAG: MBL fold metallo-hydrolase [Methylocystis sp.]
MGVSLKFCGAAGSVTGACLLFETPRARFLVDCGMFQGAKTLKALNYREFPFSPRRIDFTLLTHAHIDHSGLVPKLMGDGFAGPVFATRPTVDLCGCMLPDSGYIQEMEVATLNRRNAMRGRSAVEPIYTAADAEQSMSAFRAIPYEKWIEPCSGVRVRFWNAGHILGSASIEIEIDDAGGPLRILVSGDLGPDAKLLHDDPEAPEKFDYVICEATYGDRERPRVTIEGRRRKLADIANRAHAAGGALIIPAFAVERAQELIADLVTLMNDGAVPPAPIFLDSPLAIRATDVFVKHAAELTETLDFRALMRSPFLRPAESVDESKAIHRIKGFHVVVAASGMCDAGRIRHHLRHWLWNARATVLLVGYQAQGTLGRLLRDGASSVRILGDEVRVGARIVPLDEYSAHADREETARWLAARGPIKRGIFFIHGEPSALQAMAARVEQDGMATESIVVPSLDDAYELQGARSLIIAGGEPRLVEEQVVRLDWHNDLSRLLLDIRDRLDAEADDRRRAVVLRRLRRALEEENTG